MKLGFPREKDFISDLTETISMVKQSVVSPTLIDVTNSFVLNNTHYGSIGSCLWLMNFFVHTSLTFLFEDVKWIFEKHVGSEKCIECDQKGFSKGWPTHKKSHACGKSLWGRLTYFEQFFFTIALISARFCRRLIKSLRFSLHLLISFFQRSIPFMNFLFWATVSFL